MVRKFLAFPDSPYISQNNKAIISGEPSIELNSVTIFENRKTSPGYMRVTKKPLSVISIERRDLVNTLFDNRFLDYSLCASLAIDEVA